jgi:putative transposase
MPFWKLYYHLVWTTRDRQSIIDPMFESRLVPYLMLKAQNLGCLVDAINGGEGHIHLVLSIPPKYSIAEIVHRLKVCRRTNNTLTSF